MFVWFEVKNCFTAVFSSVFVLNSPGNKLNPNLLIPSGVEDGDGQNTIAAFTFGSEMCFQ